MAFSFCEGLDILKDQNIEVFADASSTDEQDPGRYVGYGYNVFSGPVYDSDSYHFNYPILDISKATGIIKTFASSKTVYSNNTSKSKTEILKSLGQENSGGASVSTSAQIASVGFNASLETSFNTSGTESWSSVQNEEFSYYNIKARTKTVALQFDFDNEDITTLLDSNFLKSAKKISTEQQAKDFFDKYGTHLMTGYNLGGIFEMTNYYASKTSSYVRESTASFSSQVEAGLSFCSKVSASAGVEYSFSKQYGIKDNNEYSTNNYRLTTYGGATFPGVTIDQAFTYYDSGFEKGGYLYQIWTDSINDGNNVVIDVPSSSPMIPLYKLLPNDGSYSTQKSLLINQYLKNTQEQAAVLRERYKDAKYTDMAAQDFGEPSLTLSGYDKYSLTDDAKKKYFSTSSISKDSNTTIIEARKGDRISLNYTASNCEGTNYRWHLKNKKTDAAYLKPLGQNTTDGETTFDAFEVLKVKGSKIYLEFGDGSVSLKTIGIDIKDSDFIAGDGSASNPYLISNADEFMCISNNLSKNYKLACDIDLSDKDVEPIGSYDYPFTGTFDGDNHKITNLKITDKSIENTEFECRNENCKDDDKKHDSYLVGLFARIGNGATISNIILDSAKFSFAGNIFIWNAGFICGRSEGNISNCHIANSSIEHKVEDAETEFDKDNSSFGGVCGAMINGSIEKCSLENTNIKIEKSVNFKSCLGGIVGAANTMDGSISQCMVENCRFKNEVVLSSKPSIISHGGGIAGYVPEVFKINNCFVKGINYSSSFGSECTGCFTFGGFIGGAIISDSSDHADVKLLSESIVDLKDCSTTINNNSESKPSDMEEGSYIGSCIGFLSYAGDKKIGDFFDYVYAYGSLTQFGNRNSIEKISSKTTTNGLDDKDVWSGKSNESRSLIQKIVSNVVFDTDNAKKEFVKGESFYAGGIVATKEFANGKDSENFENFFVDDSDFDSQNVGTYEIRLSAYGYSDSYTVTVREPEITALKATIDETKTYLKGETIDLNDVTLKAYKEDGSEQVISASSPNVQVSYSNGSTTLAEGQNKISFTYSNTTAYVIVEAEANYANSFEIVAEPTKMVYSTKDKSIDLSGLEIEVTYSNSKAQSKRIKYNENKSDFIAYYCNFSAGENDVSIGYSDCSTQTLTIEAVDPIPEVDEELLSAFISPVNKLATVTSLDTMKELLIEAREADTVLQNEYDEEALNNNSNYVAAKTKYENGITTYKEKRIDTFVVSVTKLDHVTSLESFRDGLIEAKNVRDILLNDEFVKDVLNESAEYAAANIKYEEAMKEYKEAVKTINNDFDNAVEASFRLTFGSPTGLITIISSGLAMILTIIIAL